MYELVGIAIATSGIVTLALRKGKDPVLFGGMALGGWFVLRVWTFLPHRGENWLAIFWIAAWVWVALVGGYLRFVVGAGKPKPDSKWNCANCRYLNDSTAIVCEACQQPWQPT